MQKIFKFLSFGLIIVFFICFLAALYVGVDPNSNLSDRLRTVPILKLILKDREAAERSAVQQKSSKRKIIYKYLPGSSGDGKTWGVFDTELLLADTDLYSGPSEDKKLNEKTIDVKRYRVLERKGEWALIEVGGKERWISPKRKNLQSYRMSEEMRRVIDGGGDIVDFPQSLWHDRIVGAKVRSAIGWNSNLQKKETDIGTFYFDTGSASSLDTILSVIELLRAVYSDKFLNKVELKKETILPNIFLKSGSVAQSLACKGDHSLGLITIDRFSPSSDTSFGVLAHEYTHHMNRVLLRLGGLAESPRWVDEGLCEYFSAEVMEEIMGDPETNEKMRKSIYAQDNTDVTPGLGLTKKKFTIFVKPYLESRSKYTNQMFKRSEEISFERLFNSGNWKQNGRTSSESKRFYDTSWAVMVYLIDGNQGKHFDGLCAFLKDLRDGGKETVSIFDYIDIKTPADLDKAVREEVLSKDLIKY